MDLSCNLNKFADLCYCESYDHEIFNVYISVPYAASVYLKLGKKHTSLFWNWENMQIFVILRVGVLKVGIIVVLYLI